MLARPLAGGRGQLQGALEHTNRMSPFPSQLELPLGGGGLRTGPQLRRGSTRMLWDSRTYTLGIQPKVPDLGPVLCLCHFITSDLSSVSLRRCVG